MRDFQQTEKAPQLPVSYLYNGHKTLVFKYTAGDIKGSAGSPTVTEHMKAVPGNTKTEPEKIKEKKNKRNL